ncbi:EAL and HDOD domain-containing protein [Herminiimonas sp. CN]|uniref:EAL and HDOD domain-containing protein n=1 Tax=Herminiimonas sp. CN TaxID=1349818 RepID=UPI000687DF9D|nr:HDOD domain-containing protein [Herminiimonas sp. CN]
MKAFAHLYHEIGLRDALGDFLCVLELLDPAQVDLDLAAHLPHERTVLRVPAAAGVAADARARLDCLQAQGFRIMLDGWPAPEAVLPTGVQSLAIGRDQIGKNATPFSQHALAGPHLATDVNSPDCFNACRAAGFNWFLGNYPLYPSVGRPRNDGSSRSRLLRLLVLVARDAESRELEQLMKQDPSLSYNLLKLVSTAAYARGCVISSFSQAINVLGRRQLQRWLQLLLYARQDDDDGVNPLLPIAAMRAGLMAALCQQMGGGRNEAERAFMIGMFSLLDVLFGAPLAEILEPLELHEDVLSALQTRSGRLGAMLDLTERACSGNPHLLQESLIACKIDAKIFYRALVQACAWAMQVSQAD